VPPSTGNMTPVIQRASREDKKRIANDQLATNDAVRKEPHLLQRPSPFLPA
jgi:hypothetical protein